MLRRRWGAIVCLAMLRRHSKDSECDWMLLEGYQAKKPQFAVAVLVMVIFIKLHLDLDKKREMKHP